MWLDNASEVDILFYEPYANVIADISKNPNYKPLTIGVFGVWGAGKSTLLKLIEQKIDEDSEGKGKTLCININAWTFEGYEDAKIGERAHWGLVLSGVVRLAGSCAYYG